MKHWKLGLTFLSAFALTWTPVAGVLPGFATLEAHATETQVTLTTDNTEVTLSCGEDGMTYTGAQLKPTVAEVKYTDSATSVTKTLTAGTDYELADNAYGANINAGEGTINLKGKGDYTGAWTETFAINPVTLTGGMVSAGDVDYNAEAVNLEPTLSVAYESYSYKAADFETELQDDGITAGTHWVTFTPASANKNFIGSADASFKVNKLNLSGGKIEMTKDSFVHTGSAIDPTGNNDFAVKLNSKTVAGGEYEVSYTDGDDNVVDAADVKNAGSYKVVATAKSTGNYKNSVSKSFTITPEAADVDKLAVKINGKDSDTGAYDGSAHEPTVTVTYNGNALTEGENNDYTLAWNNGNTDVAELKAVGTYKLTVTLKNGSNMSGSKAVAAAYTITAATLEDATVTLEKSSYTYTSKQIKPEVTSVVTKDGKTVSSDDFDVTYKDNINITGSEEADKAKVTVTGKNNYAGSEATALFDITPLEFSDSKTPITIKLDGVEASEATFKNAAYSPAVTVKDSDGNTISAGMYTVAWTNSDGETATLKNADTYTVTVTPYNGGDNMTGSATSAFTINPLAVDETDLTIAPISDYTWDGTAKEATPAITTSVNGSMVTLDKDTDYTLSYENNTNAGEATVTVTGIGNYEGTSKTATYNIKADSNWSPRFSDIEDQTYTGSAIEPAFQVYNLSNNKFLVQDTDYTVEYAGNTDAGTATITITGKGNYATTTTATKTFTIAAKALAADDISVAAATYTGEALEPAVTITVGDTTYTEGTDYTVEYADNTNAGTAKATVTWISDTGNITGDTVEKEFTIGKAAQAITLKKTTLTKTFGDGKFKLGTVAGVTTNGGGKVTYTSSNTKVATVNKSSGQVTIRGAGTAKITVNAAASDNYNAAKAKAVTITVNKAANPMTVKAKTATVKSSALSKKSQTLKVGKVLTVKKAQGTVTYKKTDGSKNITINSKTGAVTLKKGMAKGTYSVKVKVTAAGKGNYKSGNKTVTFKVTVK